MSNETQNPPSVQSSRSAAREDASAAGRPQAPKKSVNRRRHLLPVGVAPIVGFDVERYLTDLKLSSEAVQYVRDAMKAPSRNPTGYVSHTIYYPCFRFGYAIGFESRDIEFGLGLMQIYRADVLGVFEQPPECQINATTPNGHPFWFDYTPDFLVLTVTGVEIWEGKHSTRLAAHRLKHPNKYQEIDGRYRSAPIEAHFEKLGFRFLVATERELDPLFVRTARHLTPYLTGTLSTPITDDERSTFVQFVRDHAGTLLKQIPITHPARRAELAFYLLARAEIFATWSDSDLTQPESIRLYPTAQDERAFHDFLEMNRPRPANLDELGYRLAAGALIEIGPTQYEVTGLTGEHVHLSAPDNGEITFTFRELLDLRPRIGRVTSAEKMFDLLYQEAPLEHRQTYAARKAAIIPYLRGGPLWGHSPKDRTVRKWRDAFLENERYGKPGDEAIFPKFYKCGRKPRRFSPDVEAVFLKLEKDHHLRPKKCTVAWLCSAMRGEIGAQRMPHLRTIYRRCAAYDRHKRDWKQLGKRIAMRSSRPYGDSLVFGPPNGYRSFVRAHMDSTPIDLSLPKEERQYLCKMVDGYDNRILAYVISDADPNAMTIRSLLIDCIQRHGVLPSEISCDWGHEHQTVWLRKTLAHLNVTLDFRAKATPRQGGPVECSFSVICAQLIHNLEGHTHLMKRVRMMTQAVDPRQFAIWNSHQLRKAIDEYCTLRNDLPAGENPSPNAIAQACEDKFGPMPRQVPSAAELQKLLLPIVRGGTRKVSERGSIRHGGKTFTEVGPKNRLLAFAFKDVEVRWLPDDPDTILVVLERPRICIPLRNVRGSARSQDIVDRAVVLDTQHEESLASAGQPSDPEDRRAQFTVSIIKRERVMKRSSKIVAFAGPARKDRCSAGDDIPTIHFS